MTILAGLLLTGVQAARETSRRMQCTNNLHQLGVGIHSFADAHKQFPDGASKTGLSLHVSLLPYVEAGNIFDHFVLDAGPSDPRNIPNSERKVSVFFCASDGACDASPALATNYLGNSGTGVQTFGYNGAFRFADMSDGGPLLARDFEDGLSMTAAMSEVRVGDGSLDRLRTIWNAPRYLQEDELELFAESCRTYTGDDGDPWSLGRSWIIGDLSATLYNHVLSPNQNSCSNGTFVQEGAYTAGSFHPDGANVLYADGHVSFVSDSVAVTVWRSLGSRNGGESISNDIL